ncbi:MAG: bifunctional folylpolyglutamate synthase/dihydrofolate synthase [Ruminococcaceae bacterium]|nr:bifunctional folylpolyglutamate synthase/dihydrofolate synthase [Oscillospiraceae bacterium]
MTFTEALEYIHSLLKFGIHPGLTRMDTLLQILGNPHKNIKCVHVAGTNGKGSTTTAISNILIEAGYNVGLYTSPYVTDFLERVQYNGEPIDKKLFSECVEIIKPEVEKMAEKGLQITEFEALTATAFLCFERLNVDILVLEVGLGGRLDATNVIDTPLVNVITSLSLDHTAVLGDTIEQIAFEKCGTIKPGGTLVCSYGQPESAVNVIKTICDEKSNSLIVPDVSSVTIKAQSVLGTHFIYNKQEYHISMSGEHQIQNMTTAIEAVNVLIEKGFSITEQNIKNGIKKTILPARVEVISKKPLVILDGGHNEDGAKAFYEAVKGCFDKNKKLYVVAGMMNDKAVENSLKPLISKADTFIAVTPENPRAMKAESLGEIAKKYCKRVIVCDDANKAVDIVKEKITEDDIFFTVGSLYLAGEVRTRLIEKFRNVD